MKSEVDLFVIGGGVNGAAVARDAVGRGLSVALAEKGDYGHATSSASTKLIHGGLRYLESYEFRLVRESLRERQTLLRLAPHLVTPLRFLLPVTGRQPRSAWTVRAGLFLYDLLAGRTSLEATGALSRAERAALPRLRQDDVRAVLHYPDCWVDDSRLVLETLLDARERGADIANYKEVVSVKGDGDGYFVSCRNAQGDLPAVKARFVVNTAGPWVNAVAASIDPPPPALSVQLVRGSHIVLPMPEPTQNDAYLLQNDDKTIAMVVPWLGRFLIVGSTHKVQGEPGGARCSDEERDFLLDCYNRNFKDTKAVADIVWSYAGVRPLVDDGHANASKVTRDYRIVSERRGDGGLVTVYGGKLTTHRKLALKVMEHLAQLGASVGREWTDTAPLHGGGLSATALGELALRRGPIALTTMQRWASTYGSEALAMIDAAERQPKLAETIAEGVPEVELRHGLEVEDVRTAEDFLYRRTKLFMLLDARERNRVTDWFAAHGLPAAPKPQASMLQVQHR